MEGIVLYVPAACSAVRSITLLSGDLLLLVLEGGRDGPPSKRPPGKGPGSSGAWISNAARRNGQP